MIPCCALCYQKFIDVSDDVDEERRDQAIKEAQTEKP